MKTYKYISSIFPPIFLQGGRLVGRGANNAGSPGGSRKTRSPKDRSDVYTSRLALTFARAEFAEKKHPCRRGSTYYNIQYFSSSCPEAQKICAHAHNFGIKSARAAQPAAAESSLGGRLTVSYQPVRSALWTTRSLRAGRRRVPI